ncbi:acyltransferase [Rhizobium sp. P32RR-XVIII]|uniref:acyltransferase family protein n=1 Tax=Rhizobium sp. P32RR-XVIII TaxID=2726738 RepID=UPI001456A1DE|nr:acyltransferase family protein [Rhizobium sp. P32RR-XVIII]NLS06768.1 acyltransferase [Rhizobium sp. P32RR-XVIII]
MACAQSALAVVLYHAGVGGFAGGYVGVDAFFVLSGYFMATMILRDLSQGTFSIVDFYVRRMRRILPALFVMVAAISALSFWLFMPEELTYYARSARATALFYSNIQFERESGYFDLAAKTKPLLHTWSLSVEEQFYLILPLGLTLLFRIRKGLILPALVLALTASLVWSQLEVQVDQTKAFYLLPFRFWELILGSLIAVYKPALNPAVAEVMPCLGIAGLLFSAMAYSETTAFPGLTALVPCLSAAAIVAFGHQSKMAKALLGNAPMAFIGGISYSIYLWHWPIIIFLPYFYEPASTGTAVGLVIVLSLLFGLVSWRFVELPFRFGSLAVKKPKYAFVILTAVVAFFVSVNAFIISKDGLPQRLKGEASRLYTAKHDGSRFLEPGCFADPDGRGLLAVDVQGGKICRMGAPTARPEFILWGDSHAAAIAPGLDIAASRAGISGVFVGSAGCPPFASGGLIRPDRVGRCDGFNKAVQAFVKESGIGHVLLAAYWRKYLPKSDLPNQSVQSEPPATSASNESAEPVKARLLDHIRELQAIGAEVSLIMDVPEMGYAVPEHLARLSMLGKTPQLEIPRGSVDARQAVARRLLDEVAKELDVNVIDPLPSLCDDHSCNATAGGIVRYKDGDHLSASGAESISFVFDTVLAGMRDRIAAH